MKHCWFKKFSLLFKRTQSDLAIYRVEQATKTQRIKEKPEIKHVKFPKRFNYIYIYMLNEEIYENFLSHILIIEDCENVYLSDTLKCRFFVFQPWLSSRALCEEHSRFHLPLM